MVVGKKENILEMAVEEEKGKETQTNA